METKLESILDALRDAREAGVASVVNLVILLTCVEGEGPAPDMTRLAEAAGVSTSAITGAVDGLIKNGLVMRRRSVQDRRVTVVELTKRGRELADRLAARLVGD